LWTAAEAARNYFWLNFGSGRFIFPNAMSVRRKFISVNFRLCCASTRQAAFISGEIEIVFSISEMS